MATRPTGGKAAGWVIGTAVLALAMAGGTWALAISPVMEQTSTARSEAQSIRDSNDILRAKIDRLRTQFAQIDDFKAELAALRRQLPTEAGLARYMSEVSTLAAANGVTVIAMTSDLGQALVPVTAEPADAAEPEEGSAEAEPEAAAETGASGDEGEEGGETPTPAPNLLEGFVGIPISITVVGDYQAAVSFVSSLQTGTERLFLVTSFQGTAMDESDASGGRPATVVGDMEMMVGGVIYVLQSDYLLTAGDDEDPEDPDEPTELPPLPAAVPGKNPLIPVGAPAAS